MLVEDFVSSEFGMTRIHTNELKRAVDALASASDDDRELMEWAKRNPRATELYDAGALNPNWPKTTDVGAQYRVSLRVPQPDRLGNKMQRYTSHRRGPRGAHQAVPELELD